VDITDINVLQHKDGNANLGELFMPHFVIHCSESVLLVHNEDSINEQVHSVANSSGLFNESQIKVRVMPFKTYTVGNKKADFIHVFSDIMEGRTTEAKANLSKEIVEKLTVMFPGISNIAVNVRDFEKATFCTNSTA
jgi:5-carboxymethyl-2-hydroxymuconate isomerase